jgi:transposase
MDIFRLKETGYGISGISRLSGADRKTIGKYFKQGKTDPPIAKKRNPRESKIEAYTTYILSLMTESDQEFPPATVIYEQIAIGDIPAQTGWG